MTQPHYVGPGNTLEGMLEFDTDVHVDGQVSGRIRTKGDLTIGPTGRVAAELHGAVIVVEGRVEGQLEASERIEIRASGKVLGTISTPTLAIEPGALYEGDCRMSSARAGQGGSEKARSKKG